MLSWFSSRVSDFNPLKVIHFLPGISLDSAAIFQVSEWTD